MNTSSLRGRRPWQSMTLCFGASELIPPWTATSLTLLAVTTAWTAKSLTLLAVTTAWTATSLTLLAVTGVTFTARPNMNPSS